MSRRDPLFVLLGLLAGLQTLVLALRLVYPDLNLDYPFMDGDSHDWIANGLRLAGHDVRYSGRAPMLPLLIALLERAGVLPWLPVLLVALFHGTVLAFYTLAARLSSRGAAFAAALALMVCHSLLGTSLQVMADVPASCLLFLSARSFLLAREEPRRYLGAGIAGGLSALTQPIGILLAAPALLTLVLRRRDHLMARTLWIGAALFAALPGLWIALRPVGEADIPARQWDLMSFHLGSVPFYGWALLSMLGLPACLVLAAGLAGAVRKGGDAPLFVVSLFVVLAGFFVFLYSWEAKRFLVYPVWMAGLLIAMALARMPRIAFLLAAVLVVGGAARPLPGEPTQIQRAWERRAPIKHLDPALVRQDRSALSVSDRRPDRYLTVNRIGNALRKRVKVVPRSWMEPWWGWMRMERLGAIGEEDVYRVWLPERAESWVVVGPLTPGPSPIPSPIPSLDAGEGGRLAERIVEELKGWDGYVALVPGAGPPRTWQLYLPFLVETTELYVPQPGQEKEILAIFDAAPNLGERRIGPVVVRRAEILGRKASLVRGTAAPLRRPRPMRRQTRRDLPSPS
ncbi:MAG TPA: glycosyltransferase family 39 protein [Thermoanaerobaculia bacterium]|nr:glycosyltransferase family 39 protein [Thermoanaerobaculia bacterium]